MKFLADESIDRPIVERLRQDGHQVLYVAELGPEMPVLFQTNQGKKGVSLRRLLDPQPSRLYLL